MIEQTIVLLSIASVGIGIGWLLPRGDREKDILSAQNIILTAKLNRAIRYLRAYLAAATQEKINTIDQEVAQFLEEIGS